MASINPRVTWRNAIERASTDTEGSLAAEAAKEHTRSNQQVVCMSPSSSRSSPGDYPDDNQTNRHSHVLRCLTLLHWRLCNGVELSKTTDMRSSDVQVQTYQVLQ